MKQSAKEGFGVIYSRVDIFNREFLQLSPGWCGSVDWARVCRPRGHLFKSQSGHMPGFQARSPVGGAGGSLPSPLSKNK